MHYSKEEFGYNFVESSDESEDTDDKFTPFQNVKYGSSKDKTDVDVVAGALIGSCGCCCCLSVILLVIGGFLLNYDKYKDKQNIVLAGAIILAIGVVAILCGLIVCCMSCMMSCATGSGLGSGKKKSGKDWDLKRLNDQYKKEAAAFKELRYNPSNVSKSFSEKQKKEKLEKIKTKKNRKTMLENAIKQDLEAGLSTKSIINKRRPVCFKIIFDGDVMVSTLDTLREQISLCLKFGTKNDTVCLIITSPGGAVTQYGLASSQLARIKNFGMKLIVCVDSIAASGGYLMASLGHKIYAAPFALIGSVGVITIVPNVHRLLEKHNIDAYVFTAGKYKRTVDVVGQVTEDGKKKVVEELTEIHQAFKDHICSNRPLIESIDDIATGEAWLAVEAKRRGLVDEIMTSDEYLAQMGKTHDIILIQPKEKKWNFDDFLVMAKTKLGFFGNASNTFQQPVPMMN